uniref:DNA 3'-5' helicase n=1 Tax=Neogobius melanostomus TaxID=47308 RepID=A0A8C6SVZ0_9GOBI
SVKKTPPQTDLSLARDRETTPIVIIVSPLVALMDDQVAVKLGISAVKLGENDEEVLNGNYHLVFGSPESWLLNLKWRSMLSSKVYQDNLAGVVVNEVHSFAKIGELHSFVNMLLTCFNFCLITGTPVLALTASAETKHRDHVTKLLYMNAAIQVTVSPNRTNIRLGLCNVPVSNLSCLDWIVKMIKEKGLTMAPIIIYCRSLKNQRSENLLLGIFHSNTLPLQREGVKISSREGHCRIVVATTALGMGLNFPNISHVVMYGSPEDVEAIVQQVGRAGEQSHATLYVIKQSKHDVTVKEVIAMANKSCFRQVLHTHFEDDTASVNPGHLCCTFCHSQCTCENNGCPEPSPSYESLPDHSSIPLKCRNVTPADKELVQDLLEEYMCSLGAKVEHTVPLQARHFVLVTAQSLLLQYWSTVHIFLKLITLLKICRSLNWSIIRELQCTIRAASLHLPP